MTSGDNQDAARPEVAGERPPEGDAELETFLGTIGRSERLMAEGRADSALAELNRLAPPATQSGQEFWPSVEVMKRLARALVYTQAGKGQEALAEWRAVREAAPPVPQFDDLRALAGSLILVQERGWENLTEEEYSSLHQQAQMLVNQQRALRSVSPLFKTAGQALSSGNEGEYANQMAKIRQGMAQAGAENPLVKPVLELMYDMVELMALSMRQQRDFERFDFPRVFEWVSPIEAKSTVLAKSEAVTTPQAIPMGWVADMGSVIASIGRITERIARLLQSLLSHAPAATHLEELGKIEQDIRATQRALGDVKAAPMADPIREVLGDIITRLLGLTSRLSVEVRPSRRSVLSLAGLASAISFIAVAGLLLLVGRLSDTELDARALLALSAFFGLVVGFGYGALRFRGFLGSILSGKAPEGRDPQAPAG
jgi:hypothetical protein